MSVAFFGAKGLQAIGGIDAGHARADNDYVNMIGLRIVAAHRLSLAGQAPQA